jgi:nitrate/nitrite-specific signal transduction histidine kinase
MNVLDQAGSLNYKRLISEAKNLLQTSQNVNVLLGVHDALDKLETKFDNALNVRPSPYNENQKVTLNDYRAEVDGLIRSIQTRINELPRAGGMRRKSRRRKTTKRRKSIRKRRNY